MKPASSMPEQPVSPADRRHFLRSVGAAACGAGLAAGAQPAAAASGARRGPASIAELGGLLANEQPVTWLLVGDSVAAAPAPAAGWRTYREHFAQRVRAELGRTRDLVIEVGTADEHMETLRAEASARLALGPQVVSILAGLADSLAGPAGRAAFGRELAALVAQAQTAGALPILHTPHPVLPARQAPYADLPAYAAIVRAVAAAAGVPCIDHFQHWTLAKPTAVELAAWLADDGVHAGVYGHRVIAQQMLQTLGLWSAASATCTLATP